MLIKSTIKALKREYGRAGIVYKIVSYTNDLVNGTQRQVHRYRIVRKIIFLPTGESRFGAYDPDERKILIDRGDVFELVVGNFVIVDDKTYFIKKVNDYGGKAYKLIIKSSDTEVLDFEVTSDAMVLVDEASYVKS